jgi:uncharacterized protein
MATELAARGLHLVLVARRQGLLESLASDLSMRYGVRSCIVSADLGTSRGTDAALEATADLEVGLWLPAPGSARAAGSSTPMSIGNSRCWT